MIKYSKFTEKQKQVVVDMYARCGSQIPEIIESCDFSISKASIYSILHENNVSLIRKTAPQYTNIVGKKFGRLTVNKIAQTEISVIPKVAKRCACSNMKPRYMLDRLSKRIFMISWKSFCNLTCCFSHNFGYLLMV